MVFSVFLFCTILITISVSGDTTAIVASSTLFKCNSLYESAEAAMLKLHQRYPDITSLKNIGESIQGRDINALRVGRGEKKIFINGAHHGKEWITSVLILEQIEYILKAYEQNESIGDQNIRKLLEIGSICFVPMVNPDGVEIARGTIANPFNVSANQVKSNARGVDLNKNYPAKWEHANQVKSPGPRGYKGEKPFSEPETKSIEEYIKANAFETVLCYHSAGNLVYWYYDQTENLERDYTLAKKLGDIMGYTVESPEDIMKYHASEGDMPGSMAGMKDWFVQDFKKPGFTIEIGSPTSSRCVEYWQYAKIWKSNKDVPLKLLEAFVTDN
jgi:g-D-glutamyl-meso-diaminopimelate peptidase